DDDDLQDDPTDDTLLVDHGDDDVASHIQHQTDDRHGHGKLVDNEPEEDEQGSEGSKPAVEQLTELHHLVFVEQNPVLARHLVLSPGDLVLELDQHEQVDGQGEDTHQEQDHAHFLEVLTAGRLGETSELGGIVVGLHGANPRGDVAMDSGDGKNCTVQRRRP